MCNQKINETKIEQRRAWRILTDPLLQEKYVNYNKNGDKDDKFPY